MYMTILFQPQPPTLADVAGGRSFPVRRVFCVGRNYAEHAREMGRDPDREPPFFFTKWAQTVVPSGTTIAYPSQTKNFHYEGELVVAIGKAGRNIAGSVSTIHRCWKWRHRTGTATTIATVSTQYRNLTPTDSGFPR
jgi:fumarylpyruvate hydrolase